MLDRLRTIRLLCAVGKSLAEHVADVTKDQIEQVESERYDYPSDQRLRWPVQSVFL